MNESYRRNKVMVDSLVKKGYIHSKAVKNAMLKVVREHFVPTEYIQDAYTDMPLPIPGDVTISAPHK